MDNFDEWWKKQVGKCLLGDKDDEKIKRYFQGRKDAMLTTWKHQQVKIDKLEQENKELVEALEFYASEKSWKDLVEEEGCLNCSMSKGVLDCIDYEDCEDELGGKRARQALAKIKKD